VELSEVSNGIAIDSSEAMLRIAERRLAERNVKGWRLLHADAFDLPFEDGEFDIIISFKLIRHFDAANRQKLLKEMRRLLKPNGWLLFDVVNSPACRWLYSKWGLEQSWVDDFHFTAQEFRQEMKSENFRVMHLHPIHRPILVQYLLDSRLRSRLPKSTSRFLNRGLNSLPLGTPLEWVAACRRV
jgi:ubiquinone/menaquinone biosynthesis C-methylase UbiE